MSAARWAALGACLLACNGPAAPSPTPATSTPTPTNAGHAPPAPRELKLDPALFGSERIATASVERRAPASELRLPGEVRASLAAAEVGALVSGRIASVSVVEGARVERGQVLAWLDAPEVARATAELLRARARAVSANNKLNRQLELEQKQATSKNALDDARTEAEVARADLLAARTLLQSLGGVEPKASDEAAVSLSARVALRAPVAGVVVRRDAVLGGPVAPDRTLFWISGDAAALVMAHVPEGVAVPREGEVATLRARGANEPCKATVRGQPGVVDRETRSVDVRLEPDAACKGLVPGAYVDVTFARDASGGAEGLVVPREAVVDVHGATVAFVVAGAPGQISVRPVRVIERGGPELLVESGLQAGEKVVTRGAVLLKGELLRAELTGD